MTPSVRTVRGPLAIAAIVVLVDQLTKHWALSALVDVEAHSLADGVFARPVAPRGRLTDDGDRRGVLAVA